MQNSSTTSPEPTGQEIAVQKKQEVALPTYTTEHRKAIGHHLGACLVVQRTYGKQGGDLQTMVNVFCEVLKDCEPEDVVKAMEVWMRKSPEFPTPADIRQIIKPEPQFSKEVYISIQERRKRGEFITDDEIRYERRYRSNMMKGI